MVARRSRAPHQPSSRRLSDVPRARVHVALVQRRHHERIFERALQLRSRSIRPARARAQPFDLEHVHRRRRAEHHRLHRAVLRRRRLQRYVHLSIHEHRSRRQSPVASRRVAPPPLDRVARARFGLTSHAPCA